MRSASCAFIAAVRSWVTRSRVSCGKAYTVATGPGARGGGHSRILRRARAGGGPRAGRGGGSATSLGRLADAVAAEIARVSAGRPVDPRRPRTARARDWVWTSDALVRARLEGRVNAGDLGPRLTVTSTVAALGTRLVWSARVVRAVRGARRRDLRCPRPGIPHCCRWSPAARDRAPKASTYSTARPRHRSRADRRARASWGTSACSVLFEDALALYRRDGLLLRLESRRDLPGPCRRPVPGRCPAGRGERVRLLGPHQPHARAVLYSLDGNRLTPTHQADAVPWPRVAAGVRFRPGTNLLEVAAPGIDGPLLALEPEEGWVVEADGTLARLGASDPAASERRAGPALARLWPGWVAAASPDPPGEHDRILLYRDAAGPTTASLPVEGAVRALASRRHGGQRRAGRRPRGRRGRIPGGPFRNGPRK